MRWKSGVLMLGAVACFAMVGVVGAEELVYRPVNPAFGGNPFNGPHLMSNATAQRQHSAPERQRATALEQFSDSIQRSLLSRISREISDAILGEDAKESGTFAVGDSRIDFQRVDGEVVINVQDLATGQNTVIQMPLPSY